MAPRRRRATPRASEGSPSTGEPTKATFEPNSRIPAAVQDTDRDPPGPISAPSKRACGGSADRHVLGLWGHCAPEQIGDFLATYVRDVATVIAADSHPRWPSAPEVSNRAVELVRASFDERLCELARCGFFGGGRA
jgi:hypothetical protein